MRKNVFLIGIMLFLIGALAVPAAAQEDGLPDFIEHTDCEVDLTGEQIPIFHFGDLSGAYAFITQPLLAGLADAIAFFNAAGGVCGAEFVSELGTHYRDTGGSRDEAQAAYDFYSTLPEKPHILVFYASDDAELLRGQVANDEIAALISAGSVEGLYGESGDEPGWIFATNPLYGDQLGHFCEFVAANPERYPDPTIGYISWPTAFGEAAYTPETIGYCGSLGVEILPTAEYFLPTATDITTNVQNLVDAGANILYTNTLASGPVAVARSIVDLGLEDEVQLAGVNWVMDTSVGLLARTALGPDGLPAVNGMVGSLPFLWWTEVQHPGIQLLRQQAELNERGLPTQNIAYLLGWSIVDHYAELYIRAANEVGSMDAIDGALIRDVLANTVYAPLGGLFTVDYADGERRAVRGNRLAQMAFMNADMTGPATSGDDALKIPQDDGTDIFIPLLIPLTDFETAPDMRPGALDD
jgi:ABC-type branched-subunit amino acid transport system substrate-binding protein